VRFPVPAGVRDELVSPPAAAVFADAELDGLPAPARRHLAAVIAPGTALATSARLRMRGRIKVGRWLPFTARQIVAPHRGFVWAARAAGVITGSDLYVAGRGEMRWTLLGLVPLVRADSADHARSAAGRAAGEAVWIPTALLPRFGVHWSASDDRHITAHYRLDSTDLDVHYELDGDGRLRSFVFDRWGDPGRTGSWSLHPFGGEVTGYAAFDGVSIPAAGRVGWFFGTDRWHEGEFFRYRITDLQLVTR